MKSRPVKISWTIEHRLASARRAAGSQKCIRNALRTTPAGIRATLEMIDAQLGFEVLVLLLDRPALMDHPREACDRGRGRQIAEVVAMRRRGPHGAFRRHTSQRASIAPIDHWRHAQRQELRRPCARSAIAPRDPSPPAGVLRDDGRHLPDHGVCGEPRVSTPAYRGRRIVGVPEIPWFSRKSM